MLRRTRLRRCTQQGVFRKGKRRRSVGQGGVKCCLEFFFFLEFPLPFYLFSVCSMDRGLNDRELYKYMLALVKLIYILVNYLTIKFERNYQAQEKIFIVQIQHISFTEYYPIQRTSMAIYYR